MLFPFKTCPPTTKICLLRRCAIRWPLNLLKYTTGFGKVKWKKGGWGVVPANKGLMEGKFFRLCPVFPSPGLFAANASDHWLDALTAFPSDTVAAAGPFPCPPRP